MKCIYCNKTVIGMDAMSVSGRGSAHSRCHQFELVSKRVFRGISLTDLPDVDLDELHHMILLERNSRSMTDNGIELF